MAKYAVQVSGIFFALADATRCAIVQQLVQGPEPVSALAAPFAMALPSFMKHLSVLERCGLIRSAKEGRVRTCELTPSALVPAERWLAEQRQVWEARTDRMVSFVETLHAKEMKHGKVRKR